jgi:hypothetical protein
MLKCESLEFGSSFHPSASLHSDNCYSPFLSLSREAGSVFVNISCQKDINNCLRGYEGQRKVAAVVKTQNGCMYIKISVAPKNKMRSIIRLEIIPYSEQQIRMKT